LADPAVDPEQHAIQHSVLETLRQTIDEELTEKQRRALVAARVYGVPTAEIARRMDTNPNALYKLLHDARKRLQKALLAKGLPPEEILAAFGLPAQVRLEPTGTSKSESGGP
jgi:RNA polymerase sigma-70 factor (ECF subfamily)